VGSPPLEVVVCEPHHRALFHWLRAAADGTLPRRGVTVVHLDGHPDLAVPGRAVAAGWPESVGPVLGAVDIASFQLAAVRIGLVERIVWLRPDYAFQIPDGERRFRVGALASGLLRVDDPSDYYVLDGGWAPTRALLDPVELRLSVLPLGAAAGEPRLAEGPTILDVDLDAFATHNPGADRLRRAGLDDGELDALRRIFAPTRLDLPADPPERIRRLEGILGAVHALASGPWSARPGALVALWRAGIPLGDLLRLARIVASLPPDGSGYDLIEDGRQLIGVPEHRESRPGEVESMAQALGALLARGALRPSLVTIARSVEDGFTPRREWPHIEWTLLRVLAERLPGAYLRFDAGVAPAPRE
jgi:hypothetical protein